MHTIQTGSIKKRNKKEIIKMKKPSPITKGTANELLVTADLMKRGYEVYKAMSLNSSCDLIFLEGRKIYRIEVKTLATRRTKPVIKTNNPYSLNPFLWRKLKDKEKFDFIAVVWQNKIKYFPLLPRFYEFPKE
jgi:Holliday junction resolvase-like predicted endonuclease